MTAAVSRVLDDLDRRVERVTDHLCYIATEDYDALLAALRACEELADEWDDDADAWNQCAADWADAESPQEANRCDQLSEQARRHATRLRAAISTALGVTEP